MANQLNKNKAPTRSYVVGFLSSVVLTMSAYLLVTSNNKIQTSYLVGMITFLAVIQLFIQLKYFLNIGNEEKPKWNLTAFIFMLIFLIILVAGSLWIMNNLNYNMMMSPEEMNHYMQDQNKKGF